jgi:hypothetical protein
LTPSRGLNRFNPHTGDSYYENNTFLPFEIRVKTSTTIRRRGGGKRIEVQRKIF